MTLDERKKLLDEQLARIDAGLDNLERRLDALGAGYVHPANQPLTPSQETHFRQLQASWAEKNPTPAIKQHYQLVP